jgi:hypothetical protein
MDLLRTSTTDTSGNPVWEVILNGQTTFSTTAADILDFDKKVQANLTQLQQDAGISSPPVTTPPVTPPPTTTGFRGIFAFNNMSNTSLFVDKPYVAGTCLTRYWAELNPSQGQYNWAIIDNDMKPWVAAGKSVIIRVSTAGWTKWQPNQNSKQGTPQWVFDQGVPFVTANDGARKPQYWHLKFLNALQTFVQAFATRYDGNPNILAIEIGVGDGGETKPDTTKDANVLSRWQAIQYTNANWWQAIQAIINMYVQAFTKTPLALMPDASFLQSASGFDEALVVNYAAKYGVMMQWNGLVSGGSLPGSFSGLKKGYPLILEQLNSANANGRSLANDLQTMLNLGAVAALVFNDDLSNTSNVATLQKYATLVGK